MKLQKHRWSHRPFLDKRGDAWVFTLSSSSVTLEMYVIGDDAVFKLHREGATLTVVADEEYESVIDEPNTASVSELELQGPVARLFRAWAAVTDIIALV